MAEPDSDKEFHVGLLNQTIATVLVGGASFLLSIVLGRSMGPEVFGTYSYVLGLAALVAILQDGGYKVLISREKTAASDIPQDVSEKLLPAAFGHVTVTTFCAVVIILLMGPEMVWLLALGFLVNGAKVLHTLVSAYYRGLGRFQTDALWQIAGRAATFGAIVAAWFIFETVEAVLLAWLASQMLMFLTPIAKPVMCVPSFKIPKFLVAASLAFLVIDAATAIYFRIDLVLLENLLGDSAITGVYAAAYRILEGTIFLMTPLSVLFFRRLRLAADGNNMSRSMVFTQSGVMFGFAVCVFVLILFLHELIFFWTFGEGYGANSTILVWLFASLLFAFPNSPLSLALIARNQEWKLALGVISAAVINIVLNFWLIPLYGMVGAAAATIVTEGVLFVFLMHQFLLLGSKKN